MMEGTDACERGLLVQENQSESEVPLLSAENLNVLHSVPLDSEPPQCQDGTVVVCPRCGRVRTLERPPPTAEPSRRHYRRFRSCCSVLFYSFLGLTVILAWIFFLYMAYERIPFQSGVQDVPKKLIKQEDFLHKIQRLGSHL